MSHRMVLSAILAAAVLASGCGRSEEDREAPARSPGGDSLAAPKAQQNQLLDGGKDAFRRRLRRLRGRPVVVNQWASWCGPCRTEFPFFRNQAGKLEGRVAFLGVNSRDDRDAARAFLDKSPMPFPHYFDKDASIARLFRGGRAWPTTAFYDRDGTLDFTHQGAYASEARLQQDIARYALH